MRSSSKDTYKLLRKQGYVTIAEAARRSEYTYSAVQQMIARNYVRAIRISRARWVVHLPDVFERAQTARMGRKRTVEFPVDEAIALYQAGWGIMALAARYACSRKVILQRLRESGIPIRRPGRPACIQRLGEINMDGEKKTSPPVQPGRELHLRLEMQGQRK